MLLTALELAGAYRIDPEPLSDPRGVFYESVRHSVLRERAGIELTVRQVNFSVSARGVLRGLHATPGEVKLVTCVRGAVLDVAVDIRSGSATYGQHTATMLDAAAGTAVLLPDGLAHGFLALADDTCMSYLCSQEYVPGTMLSFDALDPDLGLPWPDLGLQPIRSATDAGAPPIPRPSPVTPAQGRY
ncbi:dTDP-4-dehydrorhamnose 3,5-epimerase family protein [Dactylosporangium sp. NPDC051485]|uniref:dTDP-4-dehydrorhamnose 3,5-epimerase family protein n=1 Tax=Dactylosporangium sp. NPDC051485 TaxID=3154846 RepID=UPI00344356AD